MRMITDPLKLSPSDLDSLEPSEIHSLALQAAGCATKAKLLLGRCLLSMRRTEAYRERGCSSEIHYAMLILDCKREDAREMRLVARRLEELPLLTEAAEQGSVSWSHLRSVLRQATPESEEYWLEKARSCTSRELEDLLRGQVRDDGTREADRVRVEIFLEPSAAALLQTITRDICEENQKMLPVAQVFEYLMADWKAGRSGLSHAKVWEEAQRDAESRPIGPLPSEPVMQEGDDESGQPEETQPIEVPPTPWGAADARESPCPQNDSVRLATAPRWLRRVHFNPAARHVTQAQRTVLLRRDGYCCSTPGCPNTLWLHMHHIVFFCEGGATVPENLVTLCSSCHDNIHEDRLRLRGVAPHELRWEDGTGQRLGRPLWVPAEPCWDFLRPAA